jgi:methyl halide transferase
MSEEPRDWNERYRAGTTPWDSLIRSRELDRVLREESISAGTALELGCGTGTNAIWLARQGFTVTAVDVSAVALTGARLRAQEAGVTVDFRHLDLTETVTDLGPFDFVFDRGCYHCVRKINVQALLENLARFTRPGSRCLVLTGSSRSGGDQPGPPQVSEEEIRADFGGLFTIDRIREFHFEDAGGIEGPLGWSALMTRREERMKAEG